MKAFIFVVLTLFIGLSSCKKEPSPVVVQEKEGDLIDSIVGVYSGLISGSRIYIVNGDTISSYHYVDSLITIEVMRDSYDSTRINWTKGIQSQYQDFYSNNGAVSLSVSAGYGGAYASRSEYQTLNFSIPNASLAFTHSSDEYYYYTSHMSEDYERFTFDGELLP